MGIVEVLMLGRTIPSWRTVIEQDLAELSRFREFLRSEDKEVFDDLLNECRLYASYASTMAYPIREIPLLMSILFGQHRRLMELERKVNAPEDGSGSLRKLL
jgi:hypothetical protein